MSTAHLASVCVGKHMCAPGTGRVVGTRQKGRGSWLEAPQEGLTQQQAVLGGSRPGGVEDTAGNCLEQRGWQVRTCDPEGAWALACW